MSGRPSWKSAEIGLFRPFPAFFALFRRVGRASGKSRKRRKKALFLRYPQICFNPHPLNPICGTPKSFFAYFWAISGSGVSSCPAEGHVVLNPKHYTLSFGVAKNFKGKKKTIN